MSVIVSKIAFVLISGLCLLVVLFFVKEGGSAWGLGRRDPIRQLLCGKDGKLRRSAKVFLVLVWLALAGIIWIV